MATTGPSTLTYLYGRVSVCAHRLNLPARWRSRAFREVLAVTTRSSPPGSYEYQIGTVDRKSTRLNSSHSQISYAVFCLKKKHKQDKMTGPPALQWELGHLKNL